VETERISQAPITAVVAELELEMLIQALIQLLGLERPVQTAVDPAVMVDFGMRMGITFKQLLELQAVEPDVQMVHQELAEPVETVE
jgi:hypothetical protein